MTHREQPTTEPGRRALVVMAKSPRPGTVKTRLAAHLGDEAALDVYRRLLDGTLAQAERLDDTDLVLALASGDDPGSVPRDRPDAAGRDIQPNGTAAAATPDPLAGRTRRWLRLAQRGRELGERLAGVFADQFDAGAAAVVIVNSDSPPIPVEYLEDAFARLEAGKAGRLVLGPAADGGYYLIGCRRETWLAHGRELSGILRSSPMSSGALLAHTLRAARDTGLHVVQLPLWIDVDDPVDLAVFDRLARHDPPRGGDAGALREVYLHLTHRCARDCRHCYDKASEAGAAELTTDEWRAAIDQCVALGAGSFVFIGGDPLLRGDFAALVEHVTGVHGAQARFFFNSRIDETEARLLARAGHGRLRPLVSIDGPREINDALRGPGDYDDAMTSIAGLRAAGLDPVANTVLVRPVLPGLAQLARELRAAGVGRLHLILPHQRGGAGDLGGGAEHGVARTDGPGGELIPNGTELLAAVRELLPVAAEIGLTVDNLASWRRRLGARNDFCAAGCRDVAIDPCGRVHACVITAGDPAFVAGSLREQPLERIWRASSSLRLLRAARARDRAECATCPVVDACGGECWVQAHYAARAHDEPAGYTAPFPYCDLVRPLLRELAAEAPGASLTPGASFTPGASSGPGDRDCVAAAAGGGQSAAGAADHALFDCI